MSKSSDRPTTATLQRFTLNLEQPLEEFEIWTLDFPFGDAAWRYIRKVEERIRDKVNSEYIGIPYRQLNNLLVAVCPTLTHGFEKGKPRRALAVGVPSSAPAQLPSPENIQHIVREWAQWWTERWYITKHIPEDEQRTMRDELLTAINKPQTDWEWKLVSADQLLKSFDPGEPLNYTALPSLLATLLHGKESTIHGKRIQWRKVQDSQTKKLSAIGLAGQRPIWAPYRIREYKMNKEGEGFFAYALEFDLETQAGRDAPWVFVSLHAQRYGHEALTQSNPPRRVSMLTGANRARLDDFPVDSTLVKLSVRVEDDKKEWDDDLVELLERVGASNLQSPSNILENPQHYWPPSNSDASYNNDEYYIVHAEGYGYGEDQTGHSLEAGFSMTDLAAVCHIAISEHLTMLEQDKPLVPDDIQTPSGKKSPLAMRDYNHWAKKPSMKVKAWGTQQEREIERLQRYIQQRSEYQQVVQEALQRALRNREMLIAVLWHHEDTCSGIYMALREAFLLNPSDDFPPNVTVTNHFVDESLLNALDTSDKPYSQAHHDLVQKWRGFLQQQLPRHSNRFAIIETFGRKMSWGVKGAVRHACVKEDITSQMVETIRMRINKFDNWDYLGGRGNHKHRANSVAREVVLRHTSTLYGHPQTIYQAAGIHVDNLEVIAFCLKQTHTNIMYPIAIKLAADGAVEVMLPDQQNWILYGIAASALGKVFASEWPHTEYKNRKRRIKKDKKKASALYYAQIDLRRFILRVLKGLQNPTIALIEADTWRNQGIWPQLRNPDLVSNKDVLNFAPDDRIYRRNDPQLKNLLTIIRVRSGRETPQYVTDTLREFTQLAGLIDTSTGKLMHYFSIGKELVTSRGQRHKSTRHATMLDSVGAGVAYKYPQVVEFVPFFVRSDYQTEEGLRQLCRVPHYLRIAPAWPQGNIVASYPMHLGNQLVDDQLCILGMED